MRLVQKLENAKITSKLEDELHEEWHALPVVTEKQFLIQRDTVNDTVLVKNERTYTHLTR